MSSEHTGLWLNLPDHRLGRRWLRAFAGLMDLRPDGSMTVTVVDKLRAQAAELQHDSLADLIDGLLGVYSEACERYERYEVGAQSGADVMEVVFERLARYVFPLPE